MKRCPGLLYTGDAGAHVHCTLLWGHLGSHGYYVPADGDSSDGFSWDNDALYADSESWVMREEDSLLNYQRSSGAELETLSDYDLLHEEWYPVRIKELEEELAAAHKRIEELESHPTHPPTERAVYKAIANYLANTLGVDRDYVDGRIKTMVENEVARWFVNSRAVVLDAVTDRVLKYHKADITHVVADRVARRISLAVRSEE